jgi:PAS domain S-box-containing protein
MGLVLLGVSLQFLVFGHFASQLRREVARRDQELARALAHQVEGILAQPEHSLSELAGRLDAGLGGRDLDGVLETVGHFTKGVVQVQVLSEQGHVLAVSPGQPGQDLSGQSFFRRARESAGIVYVATAAQDGTRESVTLARAYRGGVVVLRLRPDEFSRAAGNTPPPGGGFIALVDDEGAVLAHCGGQLSPSRASLLGMVGFQQGFQGSGEVYQDTFEGVKGISSVAPIGSSGWRVLIFESVGHAHASMGGLYSYTLGGVGVVLLLAFLAMFAISGQILKPLEELTGQTRAVSNGRYDVAIEPAFKEFEPLAESFLTMVRNLQAREEALNLSQRRLSSTVDAMPSFLAATNAADRLELWNTEAEKLTGVLERDALGLRLQEAVPQLAIIEPALEQSSRLGIAVKWEKVNVDFGEGARMVDVLVYPLSEGGEAGAVLRIDDITDRIRMEEVMVHSEKMMTVGGLAAGMAHEINNPLGGILMSAQNMARRLSPELAANRDAAREAGIDLVGMNAYLRERGIFEHVETIRELGARAGKIVDNMLGFSRRSHSGFIPVRLSELIERALSLAANDYDMKKQIDFKTITVHNDYAPDLGEVPVNRNQIEQVLLNLLKNAAQAMAQNARERRPELWIRTARIGEEALIEIRDSGPGIPESVRDHIFEPFFTTKDVGQGTGLGLSVSYYIVTTMHNGAIEVKSREGEGAAFTVLLPLQRTSRPGQPAPERAA